MSDVIKFNRHQFIAAMTAVEKFRGDYKGIAFKCEGDVPRRMPQTHIACQLRPTKDHMTELFMQACDTYIIATAIIDTNDVWTRSELPSDLTQEAIEEAAINFWICDSDPDDVVSLSTIKSLLAEDFSVEVAPFIQTKDVYPLALEQFIPKPGYPAEQAVLSTDRVKVIATTIGAMKRVAKLKHAPPMHINSYERLTYIQAKFDADNIIGKLHYVVMPMRGHGTIPETNIPK